MTFVKENKYLIIINVLLPLVYIFVVRHFAIFKGMPKVISNQYVISLFGAYLVTLVLSFIVLYKLNWRSMNIKKIILCHLPVFLLIVLNLIDIYFTVIIE
jgi:hypothetical protein